MSLFVLSFIDYFSVYSVPLWFIHNISGNTRLQRSRSSSRFTLDTAETAVMRYTYRSILVGTRHCRVPTVFH